MSRDRQFVRMGITRTIRMVAHLTVTTVRAGLRTESLSAQARGTTAGDMRITDAAGTMDAASAIAISVGVDTNADMIVAGAPGAGSKDADQTKARVASAVESPAVVVGSAAEIAEGPTDAANQLK